MGGQENRAENSTDDLKDVKMNDQGLELNPQQIDAHNQNEMIIKDDLLEGLYGNQSPKNLKDVSSASIEKKEDLDQIAVKGQENESSDDSTEDLKQDAKMKDGFLELNLEQIHAPNPIPN